MEKKMSKDELYEEYLTRIANAYISKDFSEIYELFDEDIAWESNWVFEPRKGKDVVVKYYEDKAEVLQGSSWETYHTLVKTLDPFSEPIKSVFTIAENNAKVFLMHEIGKIMDYVLQVSDTGERSDMVIDIKINDNDLIYKIDICIPSLFKFEFYKKIN